MSLDNPTNAAFKKQWASYAKAKRLPGADRPLTNDPMEATWIGMHLWAQAVEKAGTTQTDAVAAAMAGQTFVAPDGFSVKMDEHNHHLHKPVFVGEIGGDGQFDVVWKTAGPIPAQPWSPYLKGQGAAAPAPAAAPAANATAQEDGAGQKGGIWGWILLVVAAAAVGVFVLRRRKAA